MNNKNIDIAYDDMECSDSWQISIVSADDLAIADGVLIMQLWTQCW